MFIDVQGALLFWIVCGWEDDFTGYVLDYGAYPDPKRPYFTLRDVKKTLLTAHPGTGQEGAIYAGLETLTNLQLARRFRRDDGAEMTIGRCFIDANWGNSTDVVYQFCRQSAHASVVKGRTAYVLRKGVDGGVSILPKGYEVRENVQGQVSVRRTRPRGFTEAEEQLLASQLQRLRPLAYRLDITGSAATIYASALDRKVFTESLDAEFASGFADALTKTLAGKYSPELVAMFRARQKDKNAKRPRFYPLLRLVMVDANERRFAVERVCFTGDSGWMRLEILPLTAAMLKYLPHLGKDSFFDLI